MSSLREVAEAATPGPWHTGDHWVYLIRPDDRPYDRLRDVLEEVAGEDGNANAAFIATFDPPTVLALLDVVEAAGPLVRHVGEPQDGEWDAAEERLAEALARLPEEVRDV